MRGVNFRNEKMPMATLVEQLLALRDTADASSLYAGSTPTPESVASFAAENSLPVDTGVDPRIWVGNASRIAPHYDMAANIAVVVRSEEHTSELQSLMRISYAVFCLKKKTQTRVQN